MTEADKKPGQQPGQQPGHKTAIRTFSAEARSFDPPAEFVANARIKSMEEYQRLYKESLDSPGTFWKQAIRRTSPTPAHTAADVPAGG